MSKNETPASSTPAGAQTGAESARLDGFIARPRRAVWVLSAPMIGGMLLHVAYTVTDTAFVGSLGHEALAGLTLIFPLFFVLVALANGIGSGITVLVSQAVGRRDPAAAERVGGSSIAFGVLLGCLFAGMGVLFGRPLIALLGASGAVAELAWEYFFIVALSAVLPLCNAFIRALLTGQGDARTPMAVLGLATLLNVALDPVLIFAAGMGIAGAALATAICQLLELCALVMLLRRSRKNTIRLKRAHLVPSLATIREVLVIGVPASLTQLIMSLGSVLLNRVVVSFGDGALAGYGAAARVDAVVVLPILGLSAGAVAIVGMFAGAGRVDLVRSTTSYVFRWALTIAIGLGVPIWLASSWVLGVFTENPQALQVGKQYLGFMVFAYPVMGLGMIGARLLLALRYPMLSLLVTAIRLLLLTVPLAYVAVYLFHAPIESVWWAVLAGAVTATTISLVFVVRLVWGGDPTLRAIAVPAQPAVRVPSRS